MRAAASNDIEVELATHHVDSHFTAGYPDAGHGTIGFSVSFLGFSLALVLFPFVPLLLSLGMAMFAPWHCMLVSFKSHIFMGTHS